MLEEAAATKLEPSLTTRRMIWMSIVTLVFPGYAQARYSLRAAAAWVAIRLLVAFFMVVAVQMIWLTIGIHVASAIEAFVQLRRRREKTLPYHVKWSVVTLVAGAILMAAVSSLFQAFRIPSSSMVPTIAIGDRITIQKLVVRPDPGAIIVFRQPCVGIPYIFRVVATAEQTVEVRCNRLYIDSVQVPEVLVEANASYEDNGSGEWRTMEVSRYQETIGGSTFHVFHQRGRREDEEAFGDFPSLDDDILPGCDGAQGRGRFVQRKDVSGACDQQKHFVVPAGTVFVMGDSRENANDSRFWGVVSVEDIIGRAVGIYWPFGHMQNFR